MSETIQNRQHGQVYSDLFPSVLCSPSALSISTLKKKNISKIILMCESHLKRRGNPGSSVAQIRHSQAMPLGFWASVPDAMLFSGIDGANVSTGYLP